MEPIKGYDAWRLAGPPDDSPCEICGHVPEEWCYNCGMCVDCCMDCPDDEDEESCDD